MYMGSCDTDSTAKILRLALSEGRYLVIMYMGKKEITRRKIKVLSMDEHRVYAYCFLREKNRYFIIENILSAQLCE